MQLVKLRKTVQQRVDDVPKWSVQMYPTGALSTKCQFPRYDFTTCPPGLKKITQSWTKP